MTSTTSSTEQHNGWTNRETWAAALHLSNDYALDQYARGRARYAYDGARVPDGLDPDHLGAFQRAAIADEIEGIADNLQAVALGYMDPAAPFTREIARGFVLDVGSMWRVEWREIAEHYRADIADEIAREVAA